MKRLSLSLFYLLLCDCNTNSSIRITEVFTEDGITLKETQIDSLNNWRQEKFWSKNGDFLAIRTYENNILKGEYLQVYPGEGKKVTGMVSGIKLVPYIDSLTLDTVGFLEVMEGELKVYKDGKLVETIKPD